MNYLTNKCHFVKLTTMSMHYESWIELNQDAFYHNIAQLRALVGDTVSLAIVVKGNAYGHGLAHIAMLCQKNDNIQWLCAVSLSEALLIRSFGVTKPILVLSHIDVSPAYAIEQDIDLMVPDMETAFAIHEHAQLLQKPCHVHIKIDTGMSRFGFAHETALCAIKALMQLPFLIIRGVATHFSHTSNSTSHFTPVQTDRFKTILNELMQNDITIPFRHAANSAATANHTETHFNFVRIGAAAYGLLPPTRSLYQIPIATWKTRILGIRTIACDVFVGYDLTYKTTKETTVAILPIGYYHGYNRNLSNNGIVLVITADNTRHYAPVIGRICMNQTLIDVTHIKQVAVNDEIILMGPYENLRPYDIAQKMHSFNPREVTTIINETIHRTLVEQHDQHIITTNNQTMIKEISFC